jgi:hypothetical protein
MSELAPPDWPAHSLLAQLRPDPGWQLDRACIATYSADLRVVAASLLALAGYATEPELGSAVQLVQAFRNLRDRVAIVVQRGRIHWPRNLPRAAALLDRFVYEADCNERERSWHPKFAVIRWFHPETKAFSWRAWVGSRNLTRDLSRDVGLLLIESHDRSLGVVLPELRLAVEALQNHMPAKRRSASFASELSKVRWDLPPGVNEMRAAWLDGRADRFPIPKTPQHEVIVISPFVDAKQMRFTRTWVKEHLKPTIIACDTDLIQACEKDKELLALLNLRTCAASAEEGTAYIQPNPVLGQDAGDTERESDRSDEVSGYHAKLIYMRHNSTGRLWMGSPNLTSRGWSRNFELAVELVSDARRDPWRAVLGDIASKANEFTIEEMRPSEDDAKDSLEQCRKVVCASFKCHQERRQSSVVIRATEWPALANPHIRMVVGLPWTGSELKPWPWGQPEISLGAVDLGACTDFLLFTLVQEEDEIGWLMHAPFKPALGDERDTAAIKDYLGPEGCLALVSADLQPDNIASPPWDSPGHPHSKAAARTSGELKLPTLEALMRIYLREPERLRHVARTVDMMNDEFAKWTEDPLIAKQTREDLKAFLNLWIQVGAYLIQRIHEPRS